MLQHNKEFIVFIFIDSFMTMCNFKIKSIWYARQYSCKRCSWTIENKTAKRWKLQETTNN